jgi:hypothetical protein
VSFWLGARLDVTDMACEYLAAVGERFGTRKYRDAFATELPSQAESLPSLQLRWLQEHEHQLLASEWSGPGRVDECNRDVSIVKLSGLQWCHYVAGGDMAISRIRLGCGLRGAVSLCGHR